MFNTIRAFTYTLEFYKFLTLLLGTIIFVKGENGKVIRGRGNCNCDPICDTLPDKVLGLILMKLSDPKSLLRCSLVSKHFASILLQSQSLSLRLLSSGPSSLLIPSQLHPAQYPSDHRFFFNDALFLDLTKLFSRDVSHSSIDKIMEKIKSFYLEIKEIGYVPDTDFVLKNVDEAEKEFSLCGHSEKLAIAFGLISTSVGTPFKNNQELEDLWRLPLSNKTNGKSVEGDENPIGGKITIVSILGEFLSRIVNHGFGLCHGFTFKKKKVNGFEVSHNANENGHPNIESVEIMEYKKHGGEVSLQGEQLRKLRNNMSPNVSEETVNMSFLPRCYTLWYAPRLRLPRSGFAMERVTLGVGAAKRLPGGHLDIDGLVADFENNGDDIFGEALTQFYTLGPYTSSSNGQAVLVDMHSGKPYVRALRGDS
ncbi:hypothetical protein RHSIM_Rhsim13G0207000 [Rhododendron simsii]|uniref:F-box domain-containing protein n=1 Tax=Rhododendron simsii TaxID=118357 RepID=A0A834L5J3_RHOSS|nr:hypothetical protein RHSIM_Rhsim13G0207000 [Rhododendron simsii]